MVENVQMRYEPIYNKKNIIGMLISSDTTAEASAFKWMWEHSIQLIGYSAGHSKDEAQIVLSILSTREKPSKQEKSEVKIHYNPKDGEQKKMF